MRTTSRKVDHLGHAVSGILHVRMDSVSLSDLIEAGFVDACPKSLGKFVGVKIRGRWRPWQSSSRRSRKCWSTAIRSGHHSVHMIGSPALPGRRAGGSVEVRPMRKRPFLSLVGAIALALSAASSTSAASAHRQVQVLDDCDPATFDAALNNPNACVKSGGTTFDEFIGQLIAMGRAPAWRFAPTSLELAAGGSIDAYNRGGEFHTFTEVAAFGGGCVDPLNQILGLTAVPECANAGILFATTGIAPGGELETEDLSSGTHRFQCLIHPWMRNTVVVP
ncbi:MAG TPA: hypothetical protein VGQ02_11585 [Candidatus Limnocylindrales bacterium]|nr:hypothetical protein [Candidatus Limnocylindrales bacterium]